MKKIILPLVLLCGIQKLNAQALALTTSQVNVWCYGGCTGSATANPSGGTSPYTYQWSGPVIASTQTINGLCAGTYTITVTDAVMTSVTTTCTITQPPAIYDTPLQTNISCNSACNGSAQVVASGGMGTYTYAWAPSGGTAAAASGLCPGNYSCTISSPAGCMHTQTFAITQPTPLAFSFSTTQVIQCNGGTGSATAAVSGGTPTYTYNWSANAMPYVSGPTITNAPAGTYTLTVVDANGCSLTHTLVLTQPSSLTQSLSWTYATCGNPNGTATSNPSGGTPPYTWSWNSTPVQTTQTATGLPSATYTCTVTDANGCTYSSNVYVPVANGPTVTITSTNSSCNAGCDATMIANQTGGTGPFTCLWSSGQTQTNLSNICPGTYSVTITDANACVGTASVVITQPTAISLSTSTTAATCGNPDGTATVTASGGNPGYTYLWQPSNQTTATATGLTGGSYTCTVTDVNGCTQTAVAVVNNLGGPNATMVSSTDVSCFGGNDGSLTVAATGGTTPYTYVWSPIAGTTPTLSNITAGVYTCVVTDANGCIGSASATITQPPALSVFISSFTPAGCNHADGNATSNTSGGFGTYTYYWAPSGNNGVVATMLDNLTTHTLTVTDMHGCTATTTVTIGDSCNYVWPGDANEDAVADNNDILAIGIANGATGTTRANATTSWIGQPSADWGQTFVSGTDYKFADCDGDGTIANADTNAVVANFGYTHNMRTNYAPVYDATLPDLTVHMNQSQIGSGNPGTLSVSLGTSTTPANNVYGVAFTLNFDGSLIDAASFGMNNNSSWMGTVGNNLMGVVLRPVSGSNSVEVAITRYDHTNANGFGNIADLGFTTFGSLMGTFQNQDVVFNVSNVTVISANETPMSVNMVNDTVNVCDPGVLGVADNSAPQFSLYPNPAKEMIVITLPKQNSSSANKLIITDATGRVVKEEMFSSARLESQVSGLSAGIYFCTLSVNGNIIGVQKLVKE